MTMNISFKLVAELAIKENLISGLMSEEKIHFRTRSLAETVEIYIRNLHIPVKRIGGVIMCKDFDYRYSNNNVILSFYKKETIHDAEIVLL